MIAAINLIAVLFLETCQNKNNPDILIPVQDESVKPVKHWKTHHVKLKNGRIVTFTIPAEYSDKYDKAARIYCFQDLSFEDRVAYGIKDDNESYFAICSSYEGLGEYNIKQLDTFHIRNNVLIGFYENKVPVVEKYKDSNGQIYYHVYDYETAPIQYCSWFGKGFVNKRITVKISAATVYGDTIYWASMRYLVSAMDFDGFTNRKIMHSVRIR